MIAGLDVSKQLFIINKEKESFDFSFVPASLYSDGCQNRVEVTPLRGTVEANMR
jgi:hypothetical protein